METRRAYPTIYYNSKSIQTYIDKYLESIQYTDPASGESDSLSITLGNWDGNWINGWFPDKGATLTGRLHAYNWRKEGELLKLQFGSFTLDTVSFSGPPDVMTMGGISAPANDAFKATERTKTWEGVTILQILTELSQRYGLGLVYHADTIKITSMEQNKASDSAFLATLCSDYGLCLKVYGDRIVVYDREQYKLKDAVATIDVADMTSYSYNTSLAGTYTGGKLEYTTTGGAKITATTGSGPRILKSNASATTQAEASAKLLAAINNANHEATTLSFSTMGNPLIVAGQNINITGLGRADGKYFVNKLTHTIGESYTTSFECSKVYEQQEFIVEFSGGGTATASSSAKSNRLAALKSKLSNPVVTEPTRRMTGHVE